MSTTDGCCIEAMKNISICITCGVWWAIILVLKASKNLHLCRKQIVPTKLKSMRCDVNGIPASKAAMHHPRRRITSTVYRSADRNHGSFLAGQSVSKRLRERAALYVQKRPRLFVYDTFQKHSNIMKIGHDNASFWSSLAQTGSRCAQTWLTRNLAALCLFTCLCSISKVDRLSTLFIIIILKKIRQHPRAA